MGYGAGIGSDKQSETESRRGDEGTGGSTSGVGVVRRRFLGLVGALGVGTVTTRSASATGPDHEDGGASSGAPGTGPGAASPAIQSRTSAEFETRMDYSKAQLKRDVDASPHPSNDRISDERVVSKFGKSLEHDESTGLPTVEAYESLVAACENGEGYEAIQQADLEDDVGNSAFDEGREEPADSEIEPSEFLDDEDDVEPKPLVQPETAWTYQTEGGSTAQLRIARPPAFDSAETGAEMVELYWRALTRDVPFREYDDDDLVEEAVEELEQLDAYNGPGSDPGESLTTDNVFRGVTPGCETGPYVSQFLWKDRNLGGGVEDQRIQVQAEGSDYMTDVDDWLKVQKGVVPPVDDNLPGNAFSDERRYIVTGRDMCERVHDDPPFRQLQKAAQVLVFTMNAPLDEGIPYTLKPFNKDVDDFTDGERDVANFTAQTTLPFNDFGPLYVEKKVLEASEHGQKAAWHKKWNVHRRLRPEEYGGRVHATLGDSTGLSGEYPIPDNLERSAVDGALARTQEEFDTYLLPQAYAEGSPTHPSYPAGHSVVAGAGVTVLKALFDGDYEFPDDQKVVPTEDGTELETAEDVEGDDPMDVDETLTVRGELNKLASNMALGRNRAGIHYRTDGIEGLRLGEAAAIRFMEDQLSLPDRVENLAGGAVELGLETFDGEELTVTPSA